MTHIRTVRDAGASLFQSIVDHVLRGRPGATSDRPTLDDPHVRAATAVAESMAGGARPPESAPPDLHQMAGGSGAWTCVKRAAELYMARLEGRTAYAAELEAAFKDSPCDPEWIEAIDTYLEYFGLSGHKRAVPYQPCTSLTCNVLDTLPAHATVLILGDWGTGTPTAVNLLREAATHQPDVIIHLGDIYYAGTPNEVEANFLAILNRVFDRSRGRIPIYTLSGNHDVYSGGLGYYDLLPKLNPSPPFDPAVAQPASFFCLRNASRTFQLLAMDTGLHDGDPFTVNTDVTHLEPAEAAWHLHQIASFAADGGRTILLSHHQPFTAFEPIGPVEDRPPDLQAWNPNLLATFRDVLSAGQVSAWFWGHEHNLCIYEPFGPLAKGRCIGHGAVPVAGSSGPYVPSPRIAAPPALVRHPGTTDPVQLGVDADGVYQHGYTILRIDDEARRVEASYYVDGSPGTPLYQEMLD